jgi:hypothetical protein
MGEDRPTDAKGILMPVTRREALGMVAVACLSPIAHSIGAKESPMVAMGNRAHILVRPDVKGALTECLGSVLGCGAPAMLNAPGQREPMLAFRFPDGGSVSFEFSDNAPDEQQARRGAWLELQTDDVEALTAKVVAAGLPQLHHPATPTFYFALPGGQVFGIVPRRG